MHLPSALSLHAPRRAVVEGLRLLRGTSTGPASPTLGSRTGMQGVDGEDRSYRGGTARWTDMEDRSNRGWRDPTSTSERSLGMNEAILGA